MASRKRRQSALHNALGGASKVLKTNKDDVYYKDNLFCELTKAAGMTLMKGSTPNKMDVTKASFQNQMNKALKTHKGVLLQNIESLIQGVEEFIEEPELFYKSLMPCTYSEDVTSSISSVPDSSIRLLLGVEVIQSPLMNCLLDKLLECLGDEEDFLFHMGQKIHVPRLVLSQFRFLDRIVDGKELTNKLLEVLHATNVVDVQKEIIACVPDIVEDSQHRHVAKALRDELVNNRELTCAVIDALTYLSVPTDLFSEVRASVVDMLGSFSLSDLPIVVNFLLEGSTAKEALEMVNEIRANMSFTTSLRSLTAEEMEKVKSNIKLIIEALKSRMQNQRFVADSWMKAMDSAKDGKLLDVFIVLLLHSMNNKKSTESLVRNRIRAGLFNEPLLTKAFKDPYIQALRGYFPSILSLAQTLLRSVEPNICQIGTSVYNLAFQNFDTFCQQEVVDQLVSHLGSGSSGEVDAALDTLGDLVTLELEAVARYAVYLKVVLDYLDHNNLTVTQIRKLYLLLAKIAFCYELDKGYLQDDLHIIIRKQLTGANVKYKRMGVMGAVSMIEAKASVGTSDAGSQELSSDHYQMVIDILELVQSSGRDDPDIEALFLDSLASVMSTQGLVASVEGWIDDNMTKVFEDSYVVDLEEDQGPSGTSLATQPMYDLNHSEGSIGVDITGLARKLYHKPPSGVKGPNPTPQCLCPLFHMVSICTKRHHQRDSPDDSTTSTGLEDIAALLGCPLILPAREVYDSMANLAERDKDLVCASLFLAINWLREVVNSFGPVKHPEMKGKVMLRLKHITELNDLLEKCLVQHPTFRPMTPTFPTENMTPPLVPGTSSASEKISGAGGEKKRGRKPGKGGRKKAGKENENTQNQTILSQIDQAQESQTSQAKSQADRGKPEEKMVKLSAYRPYLRELDLEVFTILKAGLITRASMDTELNVTVSQQISMDLPELQFLLEDLWAKLNHALLASSNKRRSFLARLHADRADAGCFAKLDQKFRPHEVARHILEILPCLLNHAEEACNFFQSQMAANDGLEDGPGRFEPQSVKMGMCYHLLLKCLLCFFSWNGFASSDNKALLRQALAAVTARMHVAQDQPSSSLLTQGEVLKGSFQYLGNLSDTVPGLECAGTLLKLLMVVADMQQDETFGQKLAEKAKSFLGKEWRGSDGQLPKGAKHNEQLQMVIKAYVVYSSNPFEALDELTTQGLANMDSNRDTGFVSLNKHSFSTYYKVVLSELITCMKRIPVGRRKDSHEVQEQLLVSWMMAVKVLHGAVKLTKIFSARSNLMGALKCGRQFVEIFLRQGMPLLDVTFRRHPTEVQNLLRLLQGSTRTLHHLCGHSKITKDMSLTNQVPMLKRSLEAFVYRVKAMLTVNNCQEAFWMGNLKNRDLQGQEILTQNSEACTQNAGSEDEEDDHGIEEEEGGESDVEINEADDDQTVDSNADAGSYSEVF